MADRFEERERNFARMAARERRLASEARENLIATIGSRSTSLDCARVEVSYWDEDLLTDSERAELRGHEPTDHCGHFYVFVANTNDDPEWHPAGAAEDAVHAWWDENRQGFALQIDDIGAA